MVIVLLSQRLKLTVDFFQVVIILFTFTLMCQRGYEAVEPFIDMDSLEEITRRNSATLLIGPRMSLFC